MMKNQRSNIIGDKVACDGKIDKINKSDKIILKNKRINYIL